MSEQICSSCGKPLSQCICDLEGAVHKAREGKAEKIVIRHEFENLPSERKGSEPTKEELKQQLEERTEQLSTIALKKLEGDVRQWASVIKDEGKREEVVNRIIGTEDPVAAFEQSKITASVIAQALNLGNIPIEKDDNPEDVEKPPPKGIAGALPKELELKMQGGMKVIDELYNILENPQSTEAEKKEANKRLESIFDGFIGGRREAYTKRPSHSWDFAFTVCPKCNNPIPMKRGDKKVGSCPHCGAVLTRRVE